METKFTPAPWYPIDIAGWQHIHAEPYYDAIDLLNDEECEEAKHNIKLACAAPDLLDALLNLNAALDNYWNSEVKSQALIKLICQYQQQSLSAINKALS